MQYYGARAPEFRIVNLLEDGILAFFLAGDSAAAEARLRAMLAAARDIYRAELALVTCSSVTPAVMERLRRDTEIPVLKIDDVMAERALSLGRRLGIAVTFPPTEASSTRLLREASERSGVEVELVPRFIPGAYDALLGGNPERHDGLLLEGLDALAGQDLDAIVLAQVSMARILERAEGRYRIPLLSSLPLSLEAVREALA